MAISQSRQNFLDSSDAEAVREILIDMTKSSVYKTTTSLGVDDPKQFVKKHLDYLKPPYQYRSRTIPFKPTFEIKNSLNS